MTFDFPSHYTWSTWGGISSIKILSEGMPVDLTDCEISIKIKHFYSIASPVICELSNKDNTIVVIDPLQGSIKVPAQNISIPEGKYRYSLKIITPAKIQKTYLSGVWDILPSVSRISTSVKVPVISSTEITYTPTYQFTFTPQVTSDSDSDGYTNISELSAGTNPNDATDFPQLLFNVFNDV